MISTTSYHLGSELRFGKKAIKEEEEEFMKNDDDTNPGSFLFGCRGKWRVLPCVVCEYFSVLVIEVPNLGLEIWDLYYKH